MWRTDYTAVVLSAIREMLTLENLLIADVGWSAWRSIKFERRIFDIRSSLDEVDDTGTVIHTIFEFQTIFYFICSHFY